MVPALLSSPLLGPLVALLAGALAALGFAPLDLWPLGLAGLALLLWQVATSPGPGRAALAGWLWGLGLFAVSLNWIATAFTFQAKMPAALGWVTVVGLAMYLALFIALPCALAARLARGQAGRALLLAGLWLPAEWARGVVLTGFAWNPLGALWLPVPGMAALGAGIGAIGLSLLALLAAIGLLWLALGPQRLHRVAGGGLLLGLGLALVVGNSGLRSSDYVGPPLVVVQPNIGQGERYDAEAIERHLATYLALTGRGLAPVDMSGIEASTDTSDSSEFGSPANNGSNTDGGGSDRPASQPSTLAPALVLWPEGAIDGLLEADAPLRARIAAALRPGDLLLAGGTGVERLADGSRRYANSLFVLDADGRIRGRFDKAHLVPLGEYVPWRAVLEPLGLARLVPGDFDFAAGPGPRTLPLPGFLPVSPMICYEIIFPGAVASRSQRPAFIANVSNDAWFGSWGPPQHLAQARLRAIEEGLPIVRATPTGISAVIDGQGQVLSRLPAGRADVLVATLPPPLPAPAFVRSGPLPALLAGLMLALAGLWHDRRRG